MLHVKGFLCDLQVNQLTKKNIDYNITFNFISRLNNLFIFYK